VSVAAIVHPKLAKRSFERAIRSLLNSPEKLGKAGVKLCAYSFPHLDVELNWHLYGIQLQLRVDGTDFPYRPVSGWWIDSNKVPLLPGFQQVPGGNGFHTNTQDGQPGCWFCFKGWREYHNHAGHQDLSWASIRRDGRYNVLQLVMQLSKDLNGMGVSRV
jgi:hypothetical protein